MGKHDEQHAAAMVKARAKHIGATSAAGDAYDKAVSRTAEALEKSRRAHEETEAAADKARRDAEQQAHAELARTAKQALAEWTQAEREAQGVPEGAFIRKDSAGRFGVHAGTGVPAAAVAHSAGHNEWIIDSESGRMFVGGDELVVRRRLFEALMAPYPAPEEGAVA